MSSGHVFADGAAVEFDAVAPGLLFELRVLSGLHQGAALPLFGERWSIGAHQDMDLELYDPGVEARHAQLHCTDGRWSVQAQEGLLQDETDAVLARIADLNPGAVFSIGGIRLCVALDKVPGWMNQHQYRVRSPPITAVQGLPGAGKSGWRPPFACSC